jgi:hypothetical protein
MEEGRGVAVSARSSVGDDWCLHAALKVETLGWGGVFVYRKRYPRPGNDLPEAVYDHRNTRGASHIAPK